MERLTRLCIDTNDGKYIQYVTGNYSGIYPNSELGNVVEKLAEYEDAEEQGLLFRLPVAEGSTVFVIDYYFECKHNFECPLSLFDKYKCEEDIQCEHTYKEYRVKEVKFNYHMIDKIGKTVFLTKEEADQKLAEMQSK